MAQAMHPETARKNDKLGKNAPAWPSNVATQGRLDKGLPEERMRAFIGVWALEGRNAATAPEEPSALISGEDRYEWVPGGFFVRLEWQHRFARASHSGLGVISYDPDRYTFFADNFDNLGFHRKYRLSLQGQTWTFSGEFERATMTFATDQQTFVQNWEISSDGLIWRPLREMKGTKLKES